MKIEGDRLDSARRVLGVLGVVAAMALLGASSASAQMPWWQLSSEARPTNLAPGGTGKIMVAATNLGDAEVNGEVTPVTITDKLPAGFTATAISATAGFFDEEISVRGSVECTLASLTCQFAGRLPAYERLTVTIEVEIAAGTPSGVENEASITGGEAPSTSVRRPLRVSSAPTPFGVERYELVPEEEGGGLATQAGSHPFQMTSTLTLNETAEPPYDQPALPKDQRFNLPAGLVGNPTPFPQCSNADFSTAGQDGSLISDECPADTAVGVAAVTLNAFGDTATIPVPVFNLVPTHGEPARFGFDLLDTPVLLDTSVRTGGDYGVIVSVDDITQAAAFLGARVTLWGVPGDHRHDNSRGWCASPLYRGSFGEGACGPSPVSAAKPPPFLTLPTSCEAPFETSLSVDSWAHPGVFTAPSVYSLQNELGEPIALDGCNRLPFEPSIGVAPDGPNASTPTGLSVGIHVPQQATLNPAGLAEASVRNTTVTLPAGVQLSPAAADGLSACSLGQIGLEVDARPSCPDAAKVGTVEIKTPLLPNPLVGAAYLATQDENPFGSLVALYLVVEDPVSGVLVKLAGKVVPDPVTGQLVSTFENTPQVPFEDLTLHFFGSARAPLSTPPLCGAYTTRTSIAPWSGNAPAEPSSTFDIASGPNGSPCANPRPFAPGFEAGSTNVQAGAYTPFTLTMSRPDADQTLAGLSVQLPPGLSGDLAKVPLCPEPQASTGECPEGSLIGRTVVSAGLGNSPFTVEGGKVFITGPYGGAPFGLSILNPAKAGPFNLGYVVVRAKVEVNPVTAALTVVSDPLPTIKDGIPLQIQHVNVSIDKPEFMFNPTDCNPMKLTGTMTSTEGASASVETPFQVTNCGSLSFKPGFSVSTSGKPSRLDGTSLDVKLTYPSGAPGTLANVAKVKVELPTQLPSRLPTLQKACTEGQFASNPEGCPAASRVGEAVASTPILAGGLSGPAYFVSHGGAGWPELIVVLKGEDGVTVDLHGETLISKGITSSTFNTVPDVPVGSFELRLPQGPYSALTTDGNPCKSKLTMPTEFVGQNGAKIRQNTKIQVTGCPKAKKGGHGSRRAKGHHARDKHSASGHGRKQ